MCVCVCVCVSARHPHTLASSVPPTATWVMPAPHRSGRFIMMADRWNEADLSASRYVWLPLWVSSVKPGENPLAQEAAQDALALAGQSPLPPSVVCTVGCEWSLLCKCTLPVAFPGLMPYGICLHTPPHTPHTTCVISTSLHTLQAVSQGGAAGRGGAVVGRVDVCQPGLPPPPCAQYKGSGGQRPDWGLSRVD